MMNHASRHHRDLHFARIGPAPAIDEDFQGVGTPAVRGSVAERVSAKQYADSIQKCPLNC
jgi:hypothetical protein